MAGNPEYQNLDSYSVPDPVTPADSPSAPALYDAVTPHGQGTAPYDVEAPLDDLGGMTAAAVALAGPGGPRQAMTETLMHSPQGFGEQDVDAGWSGGGGDSGWPANVAPPGV